jgi:hypothetical protein
MITRERAHEIATEAAHSPIRQVLALEELTVQIPRIYGFPPESISEYWIAYVDRGMPFIIQSSLVVLVSKQDG